MDDVDADALEALAQQVETTGANFSATTHPEHNSSDSASSAPPPESGVTANPGASRAGRLDSGVIVDHFPFGHPGAPVPGLQRSASMYEATHESLGDSLWAPFRSQCDWEFARWAKMRGPTSTAVTELLAIPEVCSD